MTLPLSRYDVAPKASTITVVVRFSDGETRTLDADAVRIVSSATEAASAPAGDEEKTNDEQNDERKRASDSRIQPSARLNLY